MSRAARPTQFSDLSVEIRVQIWSYAMPHRLVVLDQGSNTPIPRGINQESHFLFPYQQTFAKLWQPKQSWPTHEHSLLVDRIMGFELETDKILDYQSRKLASITRARNSPPKVVFDFTVDTLVMEAVHVNACPIGLKGFENLRYVAVYKAVFTGKQWLDEEWTTNPAGFKHDYLMQLMYKAFDNIEMICLIISDEDDTWTGDMRMKYRVFRVKVMETLRDAYRANVQHLSNVRGRYQSGGLRKRIDVFDQKWRSVVTVLTEGGLKQVRGVPGAKRLFEI
ncbi:hypothetical protein VTL71DRAFT_6426 [Oculimacula yallundae]|uniref:2EXR domain-containing protein n=1 Tax=Oculimacula yallundae TaxID=86028 RepID=A0ABR4BWY2_9HELO